MTKHVFSLIDVYMNGNGGTIETWSLWRLKRWEYQSHLIHMWFYFAINKIGFDYINFINLFWLKMPWKWNDLCLNIFTQKSNFDSLDFIFPRWLEILAFR